MNDISIERIKNIKSFPDLVKFLREELNWKLDEEDIDDLTFEYEPEELGIDPKSAVKNQGDQATIIPKFHRISGLKTGLRHSH